MIAEIIAAGSEMLTPFRQDTNSLFLTEGLNDLGVPVAFKTIVGDGIAHLAKVAEIALSRADIVVFSGGLGPTEDDNTREAAAAALGVTLNRDEVLLDSLRKRYAARNIPMPPNNNKQADVLAGATVLPNANGSAAGQLVDVEVPINGYPERRILILLPGPPGELKPMFTNQVKPVLARILPPSFLVRGLLRIALIPESLVDSRVAPIYQRFPDIETTILAGSAEIQLHFACTKPTREEAQARVAELSEAIEHELGDDIFSSTGESLEEIVLLHLGMRHLSLAAAESCTGGLLAARLTAIPNSSSAFHGGVVVYTEDMKTCFCDVPPDLFKIHGAISAEVATALAEGIRERSRTSLGVGITGLAGPSGGAHGPDEAKPIGLVYLALADENGTKVKELRLMGDRDRIRFWATQHALEMIRRHLL